MAKVLVVDDVPEIVRMLTCSLQAQGYDVSSARGGREALTMASARPPDVILLDVIMPDLDGIEVCRRLKANPRTRAISVILLTAKDREEDVIKGLDAGADDYVTKPFSSAILAARLRSALRVKHSHNAVARINEQLQIKVAEHEFMARELAQAQKLEAIGQLAAGIAHEINTPTQYIGDNTRFLQEAQRDLDLLLGKFDRLLQAAKNGTVTDALIAEVEESLRQADVDYLAEEIPRAIQQSLEGIDRVSSIVRAMKEFSHPGREKKQAIDLNHAIASTVTVSRNEWKYVAEVVTDFDPDLPPVPCLPNDFSQVVLNLIVNAAQAIADAANGSPQSTGTITIRTRRHGTAAEIRISDTGTGIPESDRPKIFDLFFTTKEVGKGTGQGLSIARSIVAEKHGGTIAFETEPGRGTTFIIRLPVTEPPPAKTGAPREPATAAC